MLTLLAPKTNSQYETIFNFDYKLSISYPGDKVQSLKGLSCAENLDMHSQVRYAQSCKSLVTLYMCCLKIVYSSNGAA